MTPQQIAAIKHSWGLLQARQDALEQELLAPFHCTTWSAPTWDCQLAFV